MTHRDNLIKINSYFKDVVFVVGFFRGSHNLSFWDKHIRCVGEEFPDRNYYIMVKIVKYNKNNPLKV